MTMTSWEFPTLFLILELNKHLAFAKDLEAPKSYCLSDNDFNDFFASLTSEGTIPQEGSCCMQDVCGLACPVPVSAPSSGYGIAMICSILVSFLVGIATFFFVKGRAVNFFVAGRSLPLWVVSVTLAAQAIDSNALLGNADLSYRYSFYDGAVLPIGLGLSLILNGLFLAHHINNEQAYTLPDIFARRYGIVVEVLVSLTTVVSFLMLLAGNLVGFGAIACYLFGISEFQAIWVSAVIVWAYTVSGGLFSVAYTDVVQGSIGWTGCLIAAFYFILKESPRAPPPSIGFPGYIYPDSFGDGGVCDMYEGAPCEVNQDQCCYNIEKWCPKLVTTGECDHFDRGAYPFGDQVVYSDQMSNFLALDPFPNAIFWNWATIFILGFGNLAALDFQARCMASRTPNIARWGCLIGGFLTFLVGIPFAFLGAITRVHYGPDSVHGEFEADSCHIALGLPTCALWKPDSHAFIRLLTHQAPPILGAWCLIGIINASMSTADGAILAMGTVFSHNILRQLDLIYPNLVTTENLLILARLSTIPFAVAAACIAAFYRSSHSAGATGYLLIVAFDIVLATVVVPLFGCFYVKKPSPRAALLAILGGAATRVVLEFVLPKDGFLLLPFEEPAFLDVGPAASTLYPPFIDVDPSEHWDPVVEECHQSRFEDYTGVDSIAALLVCFVLFVTVQFLENIMRKPLFWFPGSEGYLRVTIKVEETKSSPGRNPESSYDTQQTQSGFDA